MIFRGGLRYGSSYPDAIDAPWPLAKLGVTDDVIEAAVPWRTFRFPRKNVTRLIKYTGYLCVGLQIEHTVLEEPNLIIFWSFNFPDLKERLKEKGLIVS
jgi:hypothetical protein